MNVINAILAGNEEEFNKSLDGVDINFTNNGFTLLWVAINGSMTRPQTKKTEFANYNIITILLNKGADPNKKCILMTPLYAAVYHNRPDIVRLLLLSGANPNEPSLLKCLNKKMMLELPLHLAIREISTEIVKLLLLHDVLYNKITLDKVIYGVRKANKDANNSFNYEIYKKLKNIFEILKNNYNNAFEDRVSDLMSKFPKTGTYENYYSCFQKINKDQ
ncbi:ankyrin repeat protein [Fadolivirus algeromassiliense]|jgi:ankyrin repeat protein|uniref:Ankyrin repeat protein n=1 Tax=Fadolivirus FV1/VV64 TaxID=3070911 RepID=A0A7D3QUN6_9VIRU|nr:ankyrin repeat protein [Fadolivirus algeromassiliense]QKF94307.1 ankyrin repeat protein [Fadolivirus FV1/VV64]